MVDKKINVVIGKIVSDNKVLLVKRPISNLIVKMDRLISLVKNFMVVSGEPSACF